MKLSEGRHFVAGGSGMVGSALAWKLRQRGFDVSDPGSSYPNLMNQSDVFHYFERMKPEFVYIAAAKVGGIWANETLPAEFIYENLKIQANLIQAAHLFRSRKLLLLGSSCIYPRDCPQPIKENYLLSGQLEPTNQWYAIAKIAGIKMCQAYKRQYGDNFISAMPCNLYGPNDNYGNMVSHVIPALIRRFDEAKMVGDKAVEIWGSGKPLREFLYVDDLADACVLLMERYDDPEPINVGSGREISIGELARIIASVVEFKGEIILDGTKPDGTPRKVLDSSRIQALGWDPKTSLEEGLVAAYEDYKERFRYPSGV